VVNIVCFDATNLFGYTQNVILSGSNIDTTQINGNVELRKNYGLNPATHLILSF
jgi:hypothetical protein